VGDRHLKIHESRDNLVADADGRIAEARAVS
jgi:hypothetical protein